jgi:hypothetical protein
MMFCITIVTATMAVLSGIGIINAATFIPRSYPGFTVLNSTATPDGLFIVYGDSTTTSTAVVDTNTSTISARYVCGDNMPIVCDFRTNLAMQGLCDRLAAELDSNGDIHLPNSPRSVCLADGMFLCCTSWANKVNSLTKAMLVPGMTAAQSLCGLNWVSARTKNVKLANTCTTQCVSSRPIHCENGVGPFDDPDKE